MNKLLLLQFQSLIAEHTGIYLKEHELSKLHNIVPERMAACKIDDAQVYYILECLNFLS
ncbi:MAG TPA: hypothetical protein VJL89_11140 [Thermodesulfovibrionia bacterium]|nr:hypothetical protein [Thermodesulfovibrionia bacterium]